MDKVPRIHFLLLLLLSDETFDLGLRFELVMEVRPRVPSGMLLHVKTAEGDFTIFLDQGVVSHGTAIQKTTYLGQMMSIENTSSVQCNNMLLCVSRWWFLWMMGLMSSSQRWNQDRVCVLATGTESLVRISQLRLRLRLVYIVHFQTQSNSKCFSKAITHKTMENKRQFIKDIGIKTLKLVHKLSFKGLFVCYGIVSFCSFYSEIKNGDFNWFPWGHLYALIYLWLSVFLIHTLFNLN